MAIYLNEDQVGEDANVIAYPHLLLCMGVTLILGDGNLVGAHYTTHHTEQKVTNALLAQINGRAMVRMYMTGNFDVHVRQFGGADYTGKAQMIGYHGQVDCLDTGRIRPQDGTFVRLTKLPGNSCIVEYKRDDKIRYTNGAGQSGRISTSSHANKSLQPISTHGIVSVSTTTGGPIHRAKRWHFKTKHV